jgi:hypothetical protein
LVLSAIVCHSAIEGDAGNPKAEAFREDVLSWICGIGLVEEAESNEFALLECKLGGLSDRQRIDASWRAEGLAVLAWALRRGELPVYDKRADPYPIAQALGFREMRQDTVLAIRGFVRKRRSVIWPTRSSPSTGECANIPSTENP